MEGEDCVEVADAKACRRSRSNSKEVVNKASDEDKLDGSQDVAEKLVNSNDNVVANGAENDSVKEEGEEHEEEEDAVEEEEEEEDEEEEEEPSPAMEPCSEKEEGKIEKNGGNEHVEEEEEEEKESPCEEAVESDGSSEKWQLNIDTSGSSLASEQGASDAEEHATAAVKEEVESEPTPVQGESAPVQGESAPVQGESTPVQGDTCEPSSEETEPFIGFEDACSSEVSSILKKLIEKYEMNGFPSDDDDLSSDSEDSKTETAMFMDEVGKDGSDVATDIEKAGVSQKDAADVHSSVDIQGKVDGAHLMDISGNEEVASSTASSPCLGPVLTGRGRKMHLDLSNPAFRKPFELGWKRELVYRNTADSTSKRMADIYYYTPTGKKVRSNREVVENLVDDELTLENFTFFKEPLGLNDPTKEVIRDAKRVAQKEPTGTPPKKVQKVSPKVQKDSQSQNKPVVVIIKDSSMSSPKEGPSPDTTPKQSKPSRTFPRIKVTPLRNQRPSLGSKPASNKLKREPEDGELEMGMLPPMWKDPSHMNLTKKAALLGTSGSPKSAFVPCGSKNTLSKNSSSNAAWSNTTKSAKKFEQPCSIRCLGVMGIIPTLHCRLCLCLYHPECVGLGTLTDVIHSYICKKCQQAMKDGESPTAVNSKPADAAPPVQSKVTSTTPPPLTPISALGAGSKSVSDSGSVPVTNNSSPPPKLQRLPRPGEQPSKLQTVPHFLKVSSNDTQPTVTTTVPVTSTSSTKPVNTKSPIVGSVTTWLPSSSTIQLHSTPPLYRTDSGSSNPECKSPTTISDTGPGSPPSSSQGVLRVGGKRYIVVQKHNVLSVSPAMAATATTPATRVSVGSCDPAPMGDKAPVTLSSGGMMVGTATSSPSLIGQPPVLMTAASGPTTPCSQSVSFVQTTAGLPTSCSSAPILPKPTYLMGGCTPGLQNPPGVLLVPVVQSSPIMSMPTSDTNQQPRYVLVNAPGGGFIFSNVHQSLKNKENLQEGRIGRYDSERQFMQFFMMNLGAGYSALGQVFQYLKVQELLRAARVCRLWHDLAGQASLWRTVRMKNSQVVDWKGCADSLRRYGTEHLDLRKMLVQGKPNVMWDEFCSVVGSISSLRQLDLCKCTVPVIERIAQECPQLQSISALSIKCSSISLQFVNNLKNLQELRLKGLNGMSLNSKLDVLQNLPQLKHLTLTTFRELGRAGPTAIGSLSNLESLELGEFGDFPDSFGSCLVHLKKLQRLRLEKGQGKTCPTLSVLTGVRTMPCLVQLELINFDIKPGFDSALARCTNIRRLLIIPTYVTQSATTNHMVLGGVTRLSGSLDHFVWGVTHELLRVTELFVDQCEGHKGARLPGKASKKNGSGDSIPVLRPVPGLVADEPAGEGCDSSSKNETIKEEPSASTQQVDILSISKLTSLLTASLPKTKVKILKIPFNATWRQFLGDHNH